MGVRSSLVARRGQQVVAGDRLADRIGIGVLAKGFPPQLVDRAGGADGMCLVLAGSQENGAESGYPGNAAGLGPFPQIRVVGLGECGTRAVLGAATSPLATGEQPLTRQLLGRLSPGDLLAADRNFLSHGLLAEMLAAGVPVLWRAQSAPGPPAPARPPPPAAPHPPTRPAT